MYSNAMERIYDLKPRLRKKYISLFSPLNNYVVLDTARIIGTEAHQTGGPTNERRTGISCPSENI